MIQKAKQNLHYIVDDYFGKVEEKYQLMYSKCPNSEAKEMLAKSLNEILVDLEAFQNKIRFLFISINFIK